MTAENKKDKKAAEFYRSAAGKDRKMITVKIDEDVLLNALIDRVAIWTDGDEDTTKLFEVYYQRLIDGGCFEGAEVDVMSIVDNDYINWTTYGTREDISADFDGIEEDRILAEYNDLILYATC